MLLTLKKKILLTLMIGGCCSLITITILQKQTCNSTESLPILGPCKTIDQKHNGKKITITNHHTIPPFAFIDQMNCEVTSQTFDNKIYIANFFFVTCPTICGKMQQNMKKIYQKIYQNSQFASVKILSHSLDPTHDDVGVLKKYAEKLGVKNNDVWHFVQGNKKDIYELANQSYFISAIEDKQSPGGIAHGGHFVLVDKAKHIRGVYNGLIDSEITRLLIDLQQLLKKG